MRDENRAGERDAEGVAVKSAVRLRRPERRQMAWVAQCAEDLVGPAHAVRMVAAVVATLDVSRFCEPIQARAGVAGRDATDPGLLVGLWWGCGGMRACGGSDRRGSWRGAAKRARRFAGCAAG